MEEEDTELVADELESEAFLVWDNCEWRSEGGRARTNDERQPGCSSSQTARAPPYQTTVQQKAADRSVLKQNPGK